jgi:hypothetical protein
LRRGFIQTYDTGDMGAAATGRRRRNAMAIVAFGLALAASVALLLAPTGERQESSCRVTGSTAGTLQTDQPVCVDRVSHVSLLQDEGIGVALVLAIPVVVAGIALELQRTRWSRNAALVAGTLIAFFALLGAASIGIFYLPSAVAMFVASSHLARRPDPA